MRGIALKSQLHFKSGFQPIPVPALAHAQISASSAALGWQGIYLEVGSNFGCEMDSLMVDGHFVGLQLNTGPIRIRTRSDKEWMDTLMPSYSLWLHPEGTPFSVRHSLQSYWAGAVIDGGFLDAVLGCHYELQPAYVVQDEMLSHQLLALVGLLLNETMQTQRDSLLSISLIRSFVLNLGRRHGRPAPELPASRRLSSQHLQALTTWIDSRLGEDITVPAMAARVGLSVAHFSREFKLLTGKTPWAHVTEQRVTAACKLLGQGKPVSHVAADCGFADQSHMSRVMKALRGVSPREIPCSTRA